MQWLCFEVPERLQCESEMGFWIFLEAIGRYWKLRKRRWKPRSTTPASEACGRACRRRRRGRRHPLFSSSAAPLAISAPPTMRRNARSLSPVWMRLPMKIPASIIGNAMATVISTSRVYSPTAQ